MTRRRDLTETGHELRVTARDLEDALLWASPDADVEMAANEHVLALAECFLLALSEVTRADDEAVSAHVDHARERTPNP